MLDTVMVRSTFLEPHFLAPFYLKLKVWDTFCSSSTDATGNTMFQTLVYKLLVSANR